MDALVVADFVENRCGHPHAPRLVISTSRVSVCFAAPESMASCAIAAPDFKIVSLVGDHQRTGRGQHHAVAEGAGCPIEHGV